MTINYYQKQVYGKTLLYLKDEQQARFYKMLTGEKTINEFKMSIMSKEFGVKFKEVLPPEN